MSAKEMFEELGYEQVKGQTFTAYKFKNTISDTYIIEFDLLEKKIEIYLQSDSPFTPNYPYSINTQELKAINKQVKELGWNK